MIEKCLILMVGLLMTISWTESLKKYDPEVLRELRDQLRELEEHDQLAEKRRVSESMQTFRDETSIEKESTTENLVQEKPIPKNPVQEKLIPDSHIVREQPGVEDVQPVVADPPALAIEQNIPLEESAASENDLALHNNNCPPCSKMAVCCKVENALACCNKIYKTDDKQIEIDENANTAAYYYNDGRVRIMDFRLGILSGYDPNENACFVAAGLDFTMEDVITAAEGKTSKDINKASIDHDYKKMNANPLEDMSLLPEALQGMCTGKSIYWDERVTADKTEAAKPSRDLKEKNLRTTKE